MDENKLPHLHIRPGKKPHAKNGTPPNLYVKHKQPVSSRNSATSYHKQERYQQKPTQQTTAPTGYSILGYDVQTSKPVLVSQASRRQGLYITGIQGTGKSVLIENLIIQDIKQNMGVCLLDPHGDLTQAVLARMPDRRIKDVIYFDISDFSYPFGINPFVCSDPTNPFEVQKIVDQVRHIFEKLLGVSRDTPLLLDYLKNCTRTLIANPGYSMADIPLLLQDAACRKKLVANVSDIDVQRFWRHHDQKKPTDQIYEISSTLRRVDEFLQPISRPIVGQSTSTIDMRNVMDEGKILLVKLDTSIESVTSLIGSLIIAFILNAAKSRADLPVNKRRQFNLYADEFQRFATEDFATLLEEARKFGIGITIAHQNGSQLDANLKERARSVANLVVFKVNSKDADELAGEFDITPQEAWEEVLEEEWVEIIKPQWHERIEEQVEIEVEEDIEEIPLNPVGFLVSSSRSHIDPKVREASVFIYSVLENKTYQKNAHYRTEKDPQQLLDSLLVSVMEGQFNFFYEQMAELLIFISLEIGWINMDEYSHWYRLYNRHLKDEAIVLQDTLIHALTWLESGEADIFRQNMIKVKIDSYLEGNENEFADLREYIFRNSRMDTSESEIEAEVDKIRRYRHSEQLKKVTEEIDKLLTFSSHLLELCKGLHAMPIKVPTGQKRMVKRIQPHITYITHESEKITHPRKTIMHPQRTYADMLNEVASQLANLPIFTARVRISTEAEQEEHTIKTLDPKQQPDKPLFGQALQERIERIQERNRTPDERGISYCRPRQKVEEEIRQRQEQCSQPPQDEPPISRRPNR